jgi:Ni,Fe-hydrogenase I small subunit
MHEGTPQYNRVSLHETGVYLTCTMCARVLTNGQRTASCILSMATPAMCKQQSICPNRSVHKWGKFYKWQGDSELTHCACLSGREPTYDVSCKAPASIFKCTYMGLLGDHVIKPYILLTCLECVIYQPFLQTELPQYSITLTC